MSSKMAFQLLIGLLPLCSLAYSATYNEVCNPTVNCNSTVGLICAENGRCGCSYGPLNNKYSYDLGWDSVGKTCVGQHGSACVGTRRTPAPEGMKSVPCAEPFSCIQINNMPMGIGSCQNVPKLKLNGIACNGDPSESYCDSAKSLICINGLCQCSTFRNNTSPLYELIWDDEVSNCVAPVGKPCIGTKESSLAVGHKSIDCVVEADCVAQDGQTPGVGICQRRSSGNTGVIINALLVMCFSITTIHWFN